MQHPRVTVNGCETVRPDLRVMDYCVHEGPKRGGMAEWFKAAVLKTVVRKYRGFESYFLRQKFNVRRGDREADGARLLSECGG